MHRGGTSAVARALPALGVPLGTNLLPSGSDNPKGFWEDLEAHSINEQLLAHLHSEYDRLGLVWRVAERDPSISALSTTAAGLIGRRMSQYGGRWGFKDPRTSRLVPFWSEVITSCGCTCSYAIALRNPLSVALSLKERNEIPIEKSCFLWLHHMIPAVLDSAGAARVVVDYDLMLDDPLRQLRRMRQVLGFTFSEEDQGAAIEYLSDFLEQRLRHSVFTLSHLRLDRRSLDDVIEIYDFLLSVARSEISLDSPLVSQALIGLKSRLESYSAAFDYTNQLEEDKRRIYLTLGERDAENSSLKQISLHQEQEIASTSQGISDRDARIAALEHNLSESDARNSSLKQISLQQAQQIASFSQGISDRDRRIAALEQNLSERDSQIATSNNSILSHESLITSLQQQVTERDSRIASLEQKVGRRDLQIASVNQTVSGRDRHIAALNQRIAEQEARAAILHQTISERDLRNASLGHAIIERDQQIISMRQAVGDRDVQIASLKQIVSEYEAQIESLRALLSEREDQIAHFQRRESHLRASMSWRFTAPLRKIYGRLLILYDALQDFVSRFANRFTRKEPAAGVQHHAGAFPVFPSPSLERWAEDYVPDTQASPDPDPDVRLVAFYLPQFHPIPENDEWWGKGFTEWSNVARARPQFTGHYQPRLPGELGFYDLRVRDVQKRQVELAKSYGIGAFCFYFYWFDKKTLLEFPVRQYLERPELNLPFCLCWANENWSRRWSGVEEDVLIAQSHSPADDILFIEHVAAYMRDPRYLRINGRPVLLVYRPSLFPNARATAARWRTWARQNGLGDLYLIYPQSFEVCDPEKYGFDAATEFPPNLSDPPILTDQVQKSNPEFSGIVYDWSVLVDRSRHYAAPEYKLFRGVCPSWDNEARRPGHGTVFVNSRPEGYREWLQNAVEDTRRRFKGDERLVFVNAWNEWAEGAYLEPDQRYGYAWLRSTRDALIAARQVRPPILERIVVVTHDTYPHGAQFIALTLVRELTCSMQCEVEVVSLGEGPLKTEFAKYARVHDLTGIDHRGPQARELAATLFTKGFRHAFVNTTVSGHFLETLKQAGLYCVALVHELREIILSHQLRNHARSLAEYADRIVFPAEEVRDAFREFGSTVAEKGVVRPQGLFNRSHRKAGGIHSEREELRQ